ncbi:MAG TPA: branched-chain amino acid ABC transporter permease [Thermodesulfobacteriota bacterium]|nr:branched-chain amino acid ABC transporter permease [Thermodesulfobacteriota bacterium]
MDLASLFSCLGSPGCILGQVIGAVIIAMVLFLVASGLSLILGVLGVMNFAHGSLYMIGAYFTYTLMEAFGNFGLALFLAPIGVGIVGIILERFFIKRVYGLPDLYQLLLTYAFILVLDDMAKLVWGIFDLSVPVPSWFRRPPVTIMGTIIPFYYLFIMLAGAALVLGIWFFLAKTKFGKIINAAASDPEMLMCVGMNVPLVYTSVFALGSLLAGLGGVIASPLRSIVPEMGNSIIIESFIIVVIGGMGNIIGTFLVALLFGLMRSFGILGFPFFELAFIYILMAVVLILRPSGLFGRATA